MHVFSDMKEYKFELRIEATFFIHLPNKKPNQNLSCQINKM